MNTNAVETDALTKIYKSDTVETPALKGVSITIKAGDFVSIVGPSGSGKSTLLNLLGALDKPTSGRIMIDGVDTSTLNDNQLAELRNTKIGFVFQSYNLIPRISAIRNVGMPLLVSGLSRRERDERARSLLESLGVGDKAGRKPTQLSGGEQQRVAVARALAQDPAIILGDEPTGNLDTKNTEIMIDLFKEINRKTKKTFIIITHNMEIAKSTQRIIYLRDGLVEKEEIVEGGVTLENA
jgi:putative ABC transport system ATP-binding protein